MSVRETRPALQRVEQQHPAVLSTVIAVPVEPTDPIVVANGEGRVQIKFRAGRDLRRRLRLAAATMERTQDDILSEALSTWLDHHTLER